MRIFCLFPEGRNPKRAMVSHWGESWYTWVLHRTAPQALRVQVLEAWVGEEAKDPICLVDNPLRKHGRKRPVRVHLYPSTEYTTKTASKELHMPWRYSRLTSQGTRAQQAQDSAGSWHNPGKPDYPRHDEPVDPGSDELANHKDIFPFIIPGRNMVFLFINSPDILPFHLLHTHTCHSLTVDYGTNLSIAFLSSSGTTFQRC